jgi:hypothetical protein
MKVFCSSYCQEEAAKWKDREDALATGQTKARKDLKRHVAEMNGTPWEDIIEEESD